MQKKKIHHLKIKPFLILLASVILIILSIIYLNQLRIKNIYIKGTSYLNDYEIINIARIKDYPKWLKYSSKTLERKIKNLALVDEVKVKKNILGKVTITIKEAIPLFYNRDLESYILSNGNETNEYAFTGVPFLVNIVPEKIYKRLIKELSKVNLASIQMISEIEYQPSKSGDVIIDDTRFLFRMNDGNQVYINLINIDRLDSYPLIYTILTEKGVLELDSDNERVVFKSYKSIEENKKQEEEELIE